MAKLQIVDTTPEDVAAFMDEPLPWRIRALTAKHEGRILGIGGFAFLPDGTVSAFLQSEPELREKFPISLHRAARKVLREVRYRNITALADDEVIPAKAWLTRLGFRPYRVEGYTVYVK